MQQNNLENMGSNRARELEKIKEELVETRDLYEALQEKYKGACSRKKAVENEMKELKRLMASKVKILLDKTENDDKLIKALRDENLRIKSGKGGKFTTAKSENNSEENNFEVIYQLKQENSKYKNEVLVLKTDLQRMKDRVKELTMNCIGAPDEALEDKENIIIDLEEKLEILERENFKLQNDKPEVSTRVTNTESEKIIKDLSQQNARLRLKVANLSEKIQELKE